MDFLLFIFPGMKHFFVLCENNLKAKVSTFINNGR